MDKFELILMCSGYSKEEAELLSKLPSPFLEHYIDKKKYKYTKIDVNILESRQLQLFLTAYSIFVKQYQILKNIYEMCLLLAEHGHEEEIDFFDKKFKFPFSALAAQGSPFSEVKNEIIQLSFAKIDKLLYN